jgi:hypothetical protein
VKRPPRVLADVRGCLGVPGSDHESHFRLKRIQLNLDPPQPGTYVGGYFLADEADAQQGSREESQQRPQGEDQSGHFSTPVYYRHPYC